MQVELSLVAAIVSALLGGYVAILRYTLTAKERELERRFGDLGGDFQRLDARVNSEEKATIRQDGELQLGKQAHAELYRDIDEIKSAMVTKSEWEQRMTGVERTLGQILSDLRTTMGRYPSSSQMQAQAHPHAPYSPPRKPSSP